MRESGLRFRDSSRKEGRKPVIAAERLIVRQVCQCAETGKKTGVREGVGVYVVGSWHANGKKNDGRIGRKCSWQKIYIKKM